MPEENADSWIKKGDDFFGQKKYEEALDAYLNATDIDPTLAHAWHNMGLICRNLGQHEEECICFSKECEALRRKNLARIRNTSIQGNLGGNTSEELERTPIAKNEFGPPIKQPGERKRKNIILLAFIGAFIFFIVGLSLIIGTSLGNQSNQYDIASSPTNISCPQGYTRAYYPDGNFYCDNGKTSVSSYSQNTKDNGNFPIPPTKKSLNYGLLIVNTKPAGADISIDNVKIGISPLEKELLPGDYTLLIHKDGMIDKSKTINIKAGQKYELVPAGVSSCDSSPDKKRCAKDDEWYFMTITGSLL